MGKPTKEVELSPIEKAELEASRKAVNWVVDESDNRSCPFCAWETTHDQGSKGEPRNAFLMGHLTEKHPHATLVAYQQQTLTPNLRADEPDTTLFESLGLEVEENERFDALYVPTEIRRVAKRDGDILRWASPEKLQHYLDQGCETVPLPSDAAMPRQGSTADTKVRANELVVIKVPERRHQKYRAQQEAKTNNQVAARREELEKIKGGLAEQAFTYAKKRGYSNQQATNLANAIESGEERGTLPGNRMTITDQHGTDTS